MSKCPHMPLHNLHKFDVNRLCLLMFNLILTLFYRISARKGLNFSSKSTLEQNFVTTQTWMDEQQKSLPSNMVVFCELFRGFPGQWLAWFFIWFHDQQWLRSCGEATIRICVSIKPAGSEIVVVGGWGGLRWFLKICEAGVLYSRVDVCKARCTSHSWSYMWGA